MNKLIHSVAAIIPTKKGIPILKRYDIDRTYKGYCLPSGKVNKGETYVETLKREVKEETNLDVTDHFYYCTKENDKFSINFFIVNVSNIDDFKLNTDELEDWTYFHNHFYDNGTSVLPLTLDVIRNFPFNAWATVSEIYDGQFAERSKVPYINHIGEGLRVLEKIGASKDTKAAFCIHPIVQSDEALFEYIKTGWTKSKIDVRVLLLAMEYRNIANQYLSKIVISDINEIKLSHIEEVNHMLIADKIQNYKDFLIYHKDTHERAAELDEYFNNWINRLYQHFDENFDLWGIFFNL